MLKRYDIIGDVHGCAAELSTLLRLLDDLEGAQCDQRLIIFVGDVIDRGSAQERVLSLVQDLEAQGKAVCLLGNHEYNAVMRSLGLRKKEDKAHAAFLREYPQGSARYREAIAWMKRRPWFFTVPGLSVIHADYNLSMLQQLAPYLDEQHRPLNDEVFRLSARGAPLFAAVEEVLKGGELVLPPGFAITDKEGNVRHELRVKWWLKDPGSYEEAAFGARELKLPPGAPDPASWRWHDGDPQHLVCVGHYWLRHESGQSLEEVMRLSEHVICTDLSCVLGGELAACTVLIDSHGEVQKTLFNSVPKQG